MVAEARALASRRYRLNHPERYKQIKRAYTEACRQRINVLKAAPCTDCGGTFPPECMDFDHVRGVKVQGIAGMIDYGPEKLAEELAKCELVCANCHRTRTKNRRKH